MGEGITEIVRASDKISRNAVHAIIISADPRATEIAKADTIPISKEEIEEKEPSKSIGDDPFGALIGEGKIIEPPFDPLVLAMLPEQNTEMGPCVEAMVRNIDGYGHRFIPRVEAVDKGDQLAKQIEGERVTLENFFAYASLDDSFVALRSKVRQDIETTGNGYLEVIRGENGKIQSLIHLPSYQMRLGRMEPKHYKAKIPILELQEGGEVKVVEISTWKRFRTFAQSASHRLRSFVAESITVRWFKEFGDDRVVDCRTGEVADPSLSEEFRANEVVHFKIYSSRSSYGIPRFIGVLLTIFGDRKAEEINYVTFRNNQVPSIAILVSNGQVTDDSIDRIQEFVSTQVQGQDNYSKVLIIEAESSTDDEGEESGNVRIDMEPLTKSQIQDALFQEYSKSNQDKVRRAWRLPPILVGATSDYSRSVAETSRRLADEQVFAPERDEFDSWINRRLFPEMGIVYHQYKSNSPNTTDNAELVKILASAEKTGGMTPRVARMILEDVLGRKLPDFPEDFPIDQPFSLLMAEAVKNKADPTEPGQQVTALKRRVVDYLTGDDGALDVVECEKCGHETEIPPVDRDPVEYFVSLHRALETEWRSAAAGGHSCEESHDAQ